MVTFACMLSSSACLAQSGAPRVAATAPESAGGYSAAVNANNVFVRSSPSVNSSYPFAKLASGDIVEVLEESYGWARVRCSGPAFREAFGFVPADRRVELSPDGNTIKVITRTEIKAPNVSSKESPDASWKPIAKLAPGESLRVLGTVEGEREKAYKVALTEAAEGFINLNYLRRASSAEIEAFRVSSAGGATTPAARGAAGAPVTPIAGSERAPTGTAAAGGATDSTARSRADEVRITARPAGAPDPTAETETDVIAEREIAEIDLPDGTREVVERDAVVTQSRSSAPEPKASAQDIEALAHRREFEDLESIWEVVRSQRLENAEVAVLRARYLDLVTRANVPGEVRQMAKARGEQLALKEQIQERIYTLERLRAQRGQDIDRIRSIALSMEARSDYDAVGVLNASTVFDGNRLPALYRLQDPAVGQTVAYVSPRDDFQLATMLGVLVGIRGEKRYDTALRVNVIEPRVVDILTQRRDPQVGDPNANAGSAQSPTPSSGSTTVDNGPVQYAPVPPDAP